MSSFLMRHPLEQSKINALKLDKRASSYIMPRFIKFFGHNNMKKIVFTVLSLILLMFLVSCEDSTLPDLPDMDESMDVDAFEIGDEETTDDSDQTQVNDSGEPAGDSGETDVTDDDTTETPDMEEPDETPDEEKPEPVIKTAHLIVATVGGYDVPMSGHVYYAKDEKLNDFQEIPVVGGMGSTDGADLNVAAWENGFAVVGRHDSSSVYFFTQDFEFEQEIQVKPDTYINMQDMVYNPYKDEFVISSLNYDTPTSKQNYSNKIFILKKTLPEATVSMLEISDDESASPAKMKIIGKKLFIALQNLNTQATSAKGEIAVVDLEDYSVQSVTLPTTNPTGKIEYNENVDKNHLYLTTTGNWKQGDGALLQVNTDTYEVKKVLSESEEENNILDGDFVDLSIADNGDFFIIFSNNILYNDNSLLLYRPKEGNISKIDSKINAFAANPIDYSSVTGKIYYFVDEKSDTYLKSFDTKTKAEEKILLDFGPAALRVKYDYE